MVENGESLTSLTLILGSVRLWVLDMMNLLSEYPLVLMGFSQSVVSVSK